MESTVSNLFRGLVPLWVFQMRWIKILYSDLCYYMLYAFVLLYCKVRNGMMLLLCWLGKMSVGEVRRDREATKRFMMRWFNQNQDKLMLWIIVD